MEKKYTKYVIFGSKPIRILDTLFEFAGMLGLLWFNHTYLDGNGWIDAIFILMIIIITASFSHGHSKTFSTKEKAIKYITEEL